MAITAEQTNFLVSLYVGYFDRAPDPAGMQFWTDQIENGRELNTIAADFAASPVAKSLYPFLATPDVSTATSFITSVYQNLFNTAPDAEGLAFWKGVLENGSVAPADMIEAIIKGATGTGKQVLDNKLAVAKDFVESAANKPGFEFDTAAENAAKDALDGVTEDAATVETGKAKTDAFLGDVVDGATTNLTVNQDTLTGTAKNDMFVAGSAQNGAGNLIDTLQAVDSIDGGQGVDTLSATLNNGAVVAPSLTDVENVQIRVTAGGSAVDLSGATGAEKLIVENSTQATGTNVLGGVAAVEVNKQLSAVNLDKSTATTLSLGLDNFGTVSKTSPSVGNLDLAVNTAAKATTLDVTAKDSNVKIAASQQGAVETVTIAASGKNELNFDDADTTAKSIEVTGDGYVDLSSASFGAVTSIKAADGGIKIVSTNAAAGKLEVTTGGGEDNITLDGGSVKSIDTGAGKDFVAANTAALSDKATVMMGADDDMLSVNIAPTAGVKLDGGDGTDTIGFNGAAYTTVSGFAADKLALITNFETLRINDLLANGSTTDVSKIAGITNFVAAQGVATGGTATVSNLGANASVEIAGAAANNGALVANLKTDSGSDDVINLKLNGDYAENNDATATITARTFTVTANNVETINVESTGAASTDFLNKAGTKADGLKNTLALTDNAVKAVTVTGDQAFAFTSAATQTKLEMIDASALKASAEIDAQASTGAVTIKGTASNDVITGGEKGDTLTGGDGFDTFKLSAVGDSTLLSADTITDFKANTYGQGTDGKVTDAGGVALGATTTGDYIDLSAVKGGNTKIKVGVVSNAADAQTVLQNIDAGNAADDTVAVALDSSTGKLYLDVNNDGTADSVIELTGVTTIDEAAFLL